LSAKKKNSKKPAVLFTAEDLWIAPRSNLKGENGDRAWNDRSVTPTGSRLLELADIALGLKKPEPARKRRAASASSNGQNGRE